MAHHKTIFIFLIALFSLLILKEQLNAQSNGEIGEFKEIELLYSQTIQYSQRHTPILNNEVFLEQIGNANISLLIQNRNEHSGNSASIIQMGFSEELLLKQLGTNSMTTISQFGSFNSVELNEIGNSISSSISQKGTGHSVHLEFGAEKTNFNIQQQGYNHKIRDIGFNPKSQGYTIQQSGLTGMEIIIQQR